MTGGLAILCERTGDWAAALSRHLHRDVQVRHTRSLVECNEALAEHPRSLVVLEITSANVERALDWLASLHDRFPRARAVVVAQRGLEWLEWTAREFGCEAFTTSPRALSPLAEVLHRHLASLPIPQVTLEERVWDHLPWPAAATHHSPLTANH